MCQSFWKTVSLFRVQENRDGSVRNFYHSLQSDLCPTSVFTHSWKWRGIVKALEVRWSQHLAEANSFSFLEITPKREVWPMGDGRKTELKRGKGLWQEWQLLFRGMGQGKASASGIDYDQGCFGIKWDTILGHWASTKQNELISDMPLNNYPPKWWGSRDIIISVYLSIYLSIYKWRNTSRHLSINR